MTNDYLAEVTERAQEISEIFEQDSRRYSRALTEEQEAES